MVEGLADAALACFAGCVASLDDPLTILEFGACDGYHTALLAGYLKGREFRYYAFEPDRRLYEQLRRRAPDSVEIRFEALGHFDGMAEFWPSYGKSADGENYYGSSSIKRPNRVRDVSLGVCFEHSIEVEVRRLDSFAEQERIDIVDFIWSDIQGAEGDMIEGGGETLARTRWLYTEADGNGLYEGDVNEAQIAAMLPGFENMGHVADSVLFRNRSL